MTALSDRKELTSHGAPNLLARYTFDVKMCATVYVEAANEDQARERLNNFDGWDDLGKHSEHISVGCVSVDNDVPDLVDEEGL